MSLYTISNRNYASIFDFTNFSGWCIRRDKIENVQKFSKASRNTYDKIRKTEIWLNCCIQLYIYIIEFKCMCFRHLLYSSAVLTCPPFLLLLLHLSIKNGFNFYLCYIVTISLILFKFVTFYKVKCFEQLSFDLK